MNFNSWWPIVAAVMVFAVQRSASGQLTTAATGPPRLTMVGPYGTWLSESVLGDGPARLSFRTGKWKSIAEWRQVARARAWECIAPVDLGGAPDVRVESRQEIDGLS